MWTMENRLHLVEDNSHARAASFRYLRTAGDKKCPNGIPTHIGPYRLSKDRLERFLMRGVQFRRIHNAWYHKMVSRRKRQPELFKLAQQGLLAKTLSG